jgi:glycosyltransferase involved in cell wall biosynthesis
MLYLYGTVYNNRNRVVKCLESLQKIRAEKRFLIVDNFSTDGTYEILGAIDGVEIIRRKCSRGKGRQLAMELAKDKAGADDLFMTFDLDTVYFEEFVKVVEWGLKNIDKKTVFCGSLCYYETNFSIPWKDLNNGEDWERSAHFCHEGYNVINVKFKSEYAENEKVLSISREKRYAKNYGYYARQWKNNVDLFRGWGINSIHKLRELFHFMRPKVSRKKFILLIGLFLVVFLYVTIFKEVYSYGRSMNRIYADLNSSFIDSRVILQ